VTLYIGSPTNALVG